MASTQTLNKAPWRRLTPDEWARVRATFLAGATAKALAVEYRTTERTIYRKAREDGWRRKDARASEPPMTPDQAEAAARALAPPGDGAAACRMMAADVALGQAARAAARSAVGMLRDGHVGPAQTYARVAGLLARLERVMPPEDAGQARDPAKADAAMRFLAAELGIEL